MVNQCRCGRYTDFGISCTHCSNKCSDFLSEEERPLYRERRKRRLSAEHQSEASSSYLERDNDTEED